MLKNGVVVDVNNLQAHEKCRLEQEVISCEDYSIGEQQVFKAFKIEYSISKSDFQQIEASYDALCGINAKYMHDAFLYEGMIGKTTGRIIYPGLDTCIGISVILNDNTKIGGHFVLPFTDKAKDRYVKNITSLSTHLLNTPSKVLRVEISNGSMLIK